MMDNLSVQSDAMPAKPFPRIWPALGWILLYFAIQIIACIVALGIGAAQDPTVMAALAQGEAGLAKAGLPLMWGMLVSGVIFLLILTPYLARDRRMAVLGMDRWSDIPLNKAAIIAVVSAAIAVGFGYLFSTYVIPGEDAQSMMTEMLRNIPPTPLNIAVRFAAVALIAPIVEELLFRGLLQRSLEHRLPKWGALLLASLLFGLVHGQLKALPMLVVLGMAMGYVYQKTGSLRIPILLHIINNAMALATLEPV